MFNIFQSNAETYMNKKPSDAENPKTNSFVLCFREPILTSSNLQWGVGVVGKGGRDGGLESDHLSGREL